MDVSSVETNISVNRNEKTIRKRATKKIIRYSDAISIYKYSRNSITEKSSNRRDELSKVIKNKNV